jgi:hypothetical protein
MTSGKGAYWSQKLLNQMFGGTAFTFPTSLYFGLFSVAPTATTAGTEASGTSYARVAVVCNTTNWPAISGSTQTITSGAAITWPTAGGDWSGGSNQVAAGILDSAVGGSSNLLYFGALTQAKPVLSGDTASLASGACTIQES